MTVTSSDGTRIAFDRQGDGPALILVGGGLDDGAENVPLAAELARSFTVFNYARRGRGASGDTQPYALEREIEDLEALVAEAGGSAHAYGVSSGGALALEAAAAGVALERLAVYEVPYSIGDDAVRRWREYAEQLAGAGRDEAIELFMRVAGSSEESIAAARSSPHWPAASRTRWPTTPRAWATASRPRASRRSGSRCWSPRAAARSSSSWPATPSPLACRTLSGMVIPRQGHVADPQAVAPVLERFLGG